MASKKSAIRMVFDSMDADGTGDLDMTEIKQLAEVLFCPDMSRQMSDEEYAVMMDDMDTDKSGAVTFQEFSQWWTGLGMEVMNDAGHDVHRSMNHQHEVAVELAEIESMGDHVIYHFECQVFGVPSYNFSNRYSNLLEVHRNMLKAGCFQDVPPTYAKFPVKSGMFENHGPPELLSFSYD
eukprot:SAG11_NODE_3334_length_2519_cov_5.297521_1_plen_180_part_00